ncbi:MAG: hypothetical protein ACI9GW_003731 [Halieaceae bacterium]|jgi:hypothetical protein
MWAGAISLFMVELAHAHLMVAQHGTLNILDDRVFMVLSLPISAFEGIDDDSDGRVSMIEFNLHRASIVETIKKEVRLSDEFGECSLRDIMLSPVLPHDASSESLYQLAVMGKFTLDNPKSLLRFHSGLYGKQAAEKILEITATKKSVEQKHVFELTPIASAVVLFRDNE